jgi:hypothetical protein
VCLPRFLFLLPFTCTYHSSLKLKIVNREFGHLLFNLL